MDKITTVGRDLAKQVMAMRAVDGDGRMVTCKALRCDQVLDLTATLSPCGVAMEACGDAHDWVRELTRQGTRCGSLPRLGRITKRGDAYANTHCRTGRRGKT